MISIRARPRRVSQIFLSIGVMVPWIAKADATGHSSARVRRGEEIAQLQCSACHVVSEKQKYPPLLEDPAPSFQSIASRPQTSEASLLHFVLNTHWDQKTIPLTMPNPGLSKPDTVAVIHYILSLKGR